jgi:hypothetical protein
VTPQATDTKSSIAWVVVLTAISSFMAALDVLVVSTALPTIRLDLDASVSASRRRRPPRRSRRASAG